jgi:hypothetical protein
MLRIQVRQGESRLLHDQWQPNWARTLENADMNTLLEMSFESAKAVPRVHKAERLARGSEGGRHRPG